MRFTRRKSRSRTKSSQRWLAACNTARATLLASQTWKPSMRRRALSSAPTYAVASPAA